MSGETKKDESPWTTDSLKEKIEHDIANLEKLMDRRFTDNDTALGAALVAQEKAVAAALTATKEGISKAETAADKRFELLNELRTGVATKEQFVSIEKEIGGISERVTRMESHKQGAGDSMKGIYAAIAAVGGILAIIVMLANGVFR